MPPSLAASLVVAVDRCVAILIPNLGEASCRDALDQDLPSSNEDDKDDEAQSPKVLGRG